MVSGSDVGAVLAGSSELGDRLLGLEEVIEVASPAHTPLVERVEGGVVVRPAFGPDAASTGGLRQRVERLRTAGLGGSRLVSQDGLTALVAARLPDSHSDPYLSAQALERLQETVEQVGLEHPELRLWPGGVPATRVASLQGMQRDLMLLLPLANLVLALLLWLHFRSLAATLLPLIAVGLSVMMTLGLVGLRGEDINPMTQLTPILLLVVAVADGVHLLARFEENLRAGLEGQAALAGALRSVGAACVLTTATSVLAFLSLLGTQMAVLHSFAIITAGGFVFALLINLTLLPAALARLKARPNNPSRRWQPALERIVRGLVQPRAARAGASRPCPTQPICA